jgi:hypothetical protein
LRRNVKINEEEFRRERELSYFWLEWIERSELNKAGK